MANTISNISLANTFGDWVSTTIQTVNELNYIGNSNWTKPSGTIFLESNGTNLDVANNSFFRGAVTIIGLGSSLTVHKNQSVHGVLNLTNTDTDANPNKLIFSANGIANVNYLNVTGTGLSANVANSMYVGGTISINTNSKIDANGRITTNNDVVANNSIIGFDLTVGEDAVITRDLQVSGKTALQYTSVGQNLVVSGKTFTNDFASNTGILTVTLNSSGTSRLNNLISNTAIQAVDIYASQSANVNYINSNTNLVVVGDSYTDTLQANTAANTRTLSVTGTTSTDYIQANTAANTRTLSVTGTASVNILQANSSVNTAYANVVTISVNGNANVEQLTSNTSVLSVTDIISSNGNIIANTGTLFASNVVTPNIYFSNFIVGSGPITTTGSGSFGNLSVSGNFAISGQTIYASNTFTLSEGNQFANVPSAQFATFRVSRQTANAEVRWNNTLNYWEVRDVDNAIINGWYNRLLTANDFISLQTQISANAVSANAVINTANTNMKNYVDTANTNLRLYTNAQISANAVSANAVINTANTNMKNYVDVFVNSLQGQITSNVTSLQTQISANAVSSNAVITTANTNMKNYVDTSVTLLQTQISANAVSANAVINTANTNLKNYTDSTFVKLTGSQTINGSITITGNLAINGTTTTINSRTVETTDSLIKLAKDNTAADSLDIGFYGPYQTGGLTRYTGLFRKAADKYYLVQGVTSDPTANSISQFGSLYRATLDANIIGNLTGNVTGDVSGNVTGNVTGNASTATNPQTGGAFITSVNIGSQNVNYAASSNFSNVAGEAFVLSANRTINGTIFNGSGNITTANWGTTRTLWGQSVNGAFDVTGALRPAAGSSSAPAFSTSGDTNTGMFFPAADQIGFTTGGFDSGARFKNIFGNSPVFVAPVFVTRELYFGEDVQNYIYGTSAQVIHYSNRTIFYQREGGTFLSMGSGSNPLYVGIGTSFPTERLQVEGNLRVRGTITTDNGAIPIGFISWNPINGDVFKSKNLTIVRNGIGVYTITLASNIRTGVADYSAIVTSIDSGNYQLDTNAFGVNTMDVRTIGIDSYTSTSFVVRAIRRYNSNVVHAGGNDGNDIHAWAGQGVDPFRLTVAVF